MGLVGGGLEEAGWSYVLRPEMEKKFGYVWASVIVAVIWAAWHIPGYFVQEGVMESATWFAIFAVYLVGGSFALGALMIITKNVWLCALFHTLSNAYSTTFYGGYASSLAAQLVSTGLLIAASAAAVFLHRKNRKGVAV